MNNKAYNKQTLNEKWNSQQASRFKSCLLCSNLLLLPEAAEEQRKKDNTKGNPKKRKKADQPEAPRADEVPMPSWLERKILVHCEDSYSVNCSAMTWLFGHLRARYIWFPDPWHMVHNVGLNSIKEAGFFGSVILTSTAMDVAWGPWNTEKWFRVLQAGVAEWLMHTDETDPLLQALAPRISSERNWDIHTCPDPVSEIRKALAHSNFLKSKGEKSQISRWWVWHKRFAKWVGEDTPDYLDVNIEDVNAEWSLRLIPLVYIGIQLNYISLQNGKQILKPLSGKLVKAASSSQNQTIQSAKEQQQKARESCKNALHLATVSQVFNSTVLFQICNNQNHFYMVLQALESKVTIKLRF